VSIVQNKFGRKRPSGARPKPSATTPTSVDAPAREILSKANGIDTTTTSTTPITTTPTTTTTATKTPCELPQKSVQICVHIPQNPLGGYKHRNQLRYPSEYQYKFRLEYVYQKINLECPSEPSGIHMGIHWGTHRQQLGYQ
jgi:hypothetical protein